ncbi:MAG: hypothetical protein FJX72_19600 [Armatimonadetes bacterium]|nr:hypothetical protein [Armatimonadota bacterium]
MTLPTQSLKRPRNPLAHMLLLFAPIVVLGLIPLVPYAIARWTGAIPSEEVWWIGPGNHGPWYYGYAAIFKLLSASGVLAVLVAPYTAALVGYHVWRARKLPVVAGGLMIIAVHAALIWGIVGMFWVFD